MLEPVDLLFNTSSHCFFMPHLFNQRSNFQISIAAASAMTVSASEHCLFFPIWWGSCYSVETLCFTDPGGGMGVCLWKPKSHDKFPLLQKKIKRKQGKNKEEKRAWRWKWQRGCFQIHGFHPTAAICFYLLGFPQGSGDFILNTHPSTPTPTSAHLRSHTVRGWRK